MGATASANRYRPGAPRAQPGNSVASRRQQQGVIFVPARPADSGRACSIKRRGHGPFRVRGRYASCARTARCGSDAWVRNRPGAEGQTPVARRRAGTRACACARERLRAGGDGRGKRCCAPSGVCSSAGRCLRDSGCCDAGAHATGGSLPCRVCSRHPAVAGDCASRLFLLERPRSLFSGGLPAPRPCPL